MTAMARLFWTAIAMLLVVPDVAYAQSDTATIATLSGRADMVSGGSTLVEVRLPAGAKPASLRVTANDRDVTAGFRLRGTGTMIGLVSGLSDGSNAVKAIARDGSFRGAVLTVTSHSAGGPVLLSSQVMPWICATPVPTPGDATTPATNASGLSTRARDAQCSIAAETRYFYRTRIPASTAPGDGGCTTGLPDPSPTIEQPEPPAPERACFQPYVAGTTPAALIATTTPQGLSQAIPYIVRVERGTLNRGIYDVAVLFDPSKGWTAVDPQPQWNGKILYLFGASTAHPRLQYRSSQNWADDAALSRGFMVVDNSLTDSGYNSNRLLSAETVLMMKEHVVKHYGMVRYTIGNGCSGGAIIQNTTASLYPGLIDGLQLQCNILDSPTNRLEVDDCVRLVKAYDGPAWTALMMREGLTQPQIDARKTAINGQLDQRGCHAWYNSFAFLNRPGNYVPDKIIGPAGHFGPKGGETNNCRLPAAMVYDPVSRPDGPRCGDYDTSIALWGSPPGTTRANQSYDNVGIQYGLKALIAGAITPEEFVTINENVGGTDADGNAIPSRSVADPASLPIAYRSGAVVSGAQLARVPIIDLRGYDESGIHYIWKTFAARDRLDAQAGGHGNQIIWRYGATMRAPASLALKSFLLMDQWLAALETSAPKAHLNAARSQAQVIAAKPAAAYDLCYLTGDAALANPVTDEARCNADPRLAIHSFPREVAGGARAGNVLKCALKPIDFAAYGAVRFTPAQQARLRALYPAGVCDWTKPGVGQQPAVSPRTYAAGAGGVPLSPAPVSKPL